MTPDPRIYGHIAPYPHGLINQGSGNATARSIQLRQGGTLNEPALFELFRAVIAYNWAAGGSSECSNKA